MKLSAPAAAWGDWCALLPTYTLLPVTTRLMGAWGRVQALVRNVLLLMEASSPPYQHSSESLGMLLILASWPGGRLINLQLCQPHQPG